MTQTPPPCCAQVQATSPSNRRSPSARLGKHHSATIDHWTWRHHTYHFLHCFPTVWGGKVQTSRSSLSTYTIVLSNISKCPLCAPTRAIERLLNTSLPPIPLHTEVINIYVSIYIFNIYIYGLDINHPYLHVILTCAHALVLSCKPFFFFFLPLILLSPLLTIAETSGCIGL